MAAAKMSVITPKHASNTVTKKSGAVLSVDAVILARAVAHALRWGRSCRYGPLYLTPRLEGDRTNYNTSTCCS